MSKKRRTGRRNSNGRVQGKRAKGRRKLVFISSVSPWMKIRENMIVRTAKIGNYGEAWPPAFGQNMVLRGREKVI